jgi:hypothetical protein
MTLEGRELLTNSVRNETPKSVFPDSSRKEETFWLQGQQALSWLKDMKFMGILCAVPPYYLSETYLLFQKTWYRYWPDASPCIEDMILGYNMYNSE